MEIRTPGLSPLLRSAALAALLLLGAGVQAAPAPRPLDRERVYSDYQAGDFDKVIRALESFLDSGRPCRRADSVFVAKHLAVVYAAHPATRERGRYHMLRMLALDPRADLLDMFVGEEVDGIFEKVRREAELNRPVPRAPGKTPAPAARPVSPPRSRSAAAPASASAARPKVSSRLPPERPSAGLEAWSLDPPAPGPAPSTRAAPRPPAPAAPPPDPDTAGAAAADRAGRPRWRDPGFWIGGGAAVAVVGLTLFLAGDADKPASKAKTQSEPVPPTP